MTGRTAFRHRDEDRFAIDGQTADRLLRGALSPADSPPEYRQVSMTLRSVARPATPSELSRRAAAVDAIRAEVSAARRERRAAADVPVPRTAARTVKAVAAVVVAALSLTTGLAMAGALPDGAQRFAASVLAKVGVSAPTPHAPDHGRPRSAKPPSSGTPSVGHTSGSSGIENATPSTTANTSVSGPVGAGAPGAPGGNANPGSPPSGGPGRSDQHGNPSDPGGPGNGSNRGNGNGVSHTNSPNGVARGHP